MTARAKTFRATILEASRLFALSFAAAAALASFSWAEERKAAPANDAVQQALIDEMARSMTRLKLESFDLPYRIAYTVIESDDFVVDGSFGAVNRKGEGKSRSLRADVRVGDYTLDNSNFGGGGFGGFGGLGQVTPLPEEDDSGAIRQQVWLATDAAYKSALETFSQKKAWLETNTVPDRPDDLSKADPIERIEPRAVLSVDKDRWIAAVRDLGAVFRNYPAIQESSVTFDATARNRILLTSDGFRTRTGETRLRLSVSAGTQAEDGMNIGDAMTFMGRTEADLPALEALRAAAEDLGEKLTARVRARRAEEYIGPVLFEGEAAAEFMLQLLVDRLANPREPLGARGGGGTPFKNRLKKRVLPAFLSVKDDPLVASFQGVPLLGAFRVDDDGIPAREVTLVENGRLLSWYMSRVPTREIRESNGHSRAGIGDAGCVFVTSTNTEPESKLREDLIKNARDQELSHAVRVESLSRSDQRIRGTRGAAGRPGGGSEASLSSPVRAYWVSVQDGREEPMRGGEFQAVSLRTLRDVIVTGDRMHVLNTIRRGHPVSIAAPSFLVEEMEMKKPTEEQTKTPYLGHPYFAQK